VKLREPREPRDPEKLVECAEFVNIKILKTLIS
jgi:hypothetical protein